MLTRQSFTEAEAAQSIGLPVIVFRDLVLAGYLPVPDTAGRYDSIALNEAVEQIGDENALTELCQQIAEDNPWHRMLSDQAAFKAQAGQREATETSDHEAVLKLAALSAFEFDRVKKEEAKRLGVSIGALTAAVLAERRKGEEATREEPSIFPKVEPWPEPVDGTSLLTSISATFSRHIVLPKGAADAIALWIMHAWTHDTANISPVLGITSPTPECGKSTLLVLLGALVPRPLSASNVSASSIFRSVEKWHPTVLVDEGDTFLAQSDELRGILNSGQMKAQAFVLRTTGEEHEPTLFSTWAPKAIAMIGQGLPDTLQSRAIHVELRRKAVGETAEPVRADRLGHLEPLRSKAMRWASDHETALRRSEPDLPPALDGRRADNWRHLIAIADLAGGEWPERARMTALMLNARSSGSAAIISQDELIRTG